MACLVPRPTRSGWLVLAIPCLLVVGCAPPDDTIKTYKLAVPEKAKPEENPTPPPDHNPPNDGPPKVRFLGAIIPLGGDNAYFVRFALPLDIEKIDPLEKDFDAFLNSIRVPGEGGKPISWTVPAGWKEVPNPPASSQFDPGRVVTLEKSDGTGRPMYISNPTTGKLLVNVNRWRTDFAGIKPVTEAELPGVMKDVQLGGTKGYRVDFRGPGGKPKGPPFAGMGK